MITVRYRPECIIFPLNCYLLTLTTLAEPLILNVGQKSLWHAVRKRADKKVMKINIVLSFFKLKFFIKISD